MFDRAIALWSRLDIGLAAVPAALPLLALRVALA